MKETEKRVDNMKEGEIPIVFRRIESWVIDKFGAGKISDESVNRMRDCGMGKIVKEGIVTKAE